jgi:hypothetical protein
MPIARHATAVLAASSAITVLGLASSARAAPTGAITDVHALGPGQVAATFSTSHDVVDPDGYAGWYPFAVDAPPGVACDAYSQPVIYVGPWQPDSGSQRETKAFSMAPNHTICLYTEHGGLDTLVASQVWVPPAPPVPAEPAPSPPVPPPPPPTPTTPAAPVAPASGPAQTPNRLTLDEARRVVRQTLRRTFGLRFTDGRNYHRGCRHLSETRVRCRVSWDWRRRHYAGVLIVGETASGYTTSRSIHRTRSGPKEGDAS